MFLRTPFLLGALLGLAVLPPATAANSPGREQDLALKALKEGKIMPLRTIEGRIVPRMRGFSYLGPEIDAASMRYRLKFMRGPQVVWIDVDARTGQIVGHSGS